ncbi:unnamed protein product [Nippostrongylus brasiliensis]|uniref:Importin-5 n=1 Tax=Nippostrongylus brasiliensis TaxID=27835 RepID=A0A0N4Y222_NIPBR|nr:unnamed protein product [Nippostrongylus brasiliensis]
MKECSDVLRQILNSPQHPNVKNWCAEILQAINAHVAQEEPAAVESHEQINDEYLDVGIWNAGRGGEGRDMEKS